MKTILLMLCFISNYSLISLPYNIANTQVIVNCNQSSSQTISLKKVRASYKDAAGDKEKVPFFNALLSSVTTDDRVELLGYKGAGIALKGKHAKKLKDKRDLFIEGVTLLENTIAKAPNNVELRFIRIGIQENVPKLLKYKANIEEDKLVLLAKYQNIKDKDLKNHIGAYIQQSTVFTAQEKQKIAQ